MSLDEATLRRVIREEVAKLLPRAQIKTLQLTVPKCARLYVTSVRRIRDYIDEGTLAAVWREGGHCGVGKGQWMVSAASAEHHPKLGGGVS